MSAFVARDHLPYSASELFDLVADVERYPEFMPWVIGSRITRRESQTIHVEMIVGVGPVRKRFSTIGVLHRPHRIDIISHDPTFEHFEQHWTFETRQGTDIEYRVDFRFKSRSLQIVMGALLADQAAMTISAFRLRASRLCGAAG